MSKGKAKAKESEEVKPLIKEPQKPNEGQYTHFNFREDGNHWDYQNTLYPGRNLKALYFRAENASRVELKQDQKTYKLNKVREKGVYYFYKIFEGHDISQSPLTIDIEVKKKLEMSRHVFMVTDGFGGIARADCQECTKKEEKEVKK